VEDPADLHPHGLGDRGEALRVAEHAGRLAVHGTDDDDGHRARRVRSSSGRGDERGGDERGEDRDQDRDEECGASDA
jgi:hypothetical protein